MEQGSAGREFQPRVKTRQYSLVLKSKMTNDFLSYFPPHSETNKRSDGDISFVLCCGKINDYSASISIGLFNIGSVTRLGDLFDFGQVLKPLATINLSKSPTFIGNFCKGVKIYHFLVKSFLGNFL